MTIGIERLLRHMAWANQKAIEHMETMPEEALKSFATNSEWFASEILHHIVDSADAYAYRITGAHPLNEGVKITEIEDLGSCAIQRTSKSG